MKRVAIEGEDLDRPRVRIDEPVLANAGTSIERALGEQIVPAVRGAKDLNYEIRRALDTARHDLGLSARKDDENVGLHGIGTGEENVDRRRAPPSSQILYEWNEEANQRRN